ncbi:hypothetical protein NFJ02_05g119280 [Pycnococcus provasolii]
MESVRDTVKVVPSARARNVVDSTWLTSSQRNDAKLATLVAAEDNRKRKIEETEDEKAHVDASYRSRF